MKNNHMMIWPGSELYKSRHLGLLERVYCLLFGVPIIGLRIRLRWLAKHLPKGANTVLDAGCGRGVISRYMANRLPQAQVTAIDMDAKVQEQNQQIADAVGLTNCSFKVADIIKLDEKGKYDLVVSVDNLEHIEDDVAAMKVLYDALLPGGRLLVHVPAYYRRWPVVKWSENFDVPGHFRPGYHMDELLQRLRSVGFEVERAGYSYGFLENLSNNISYAITGAREKNKIVYAIMFPLLNLIAFMGQWGAPRKGAGVWARAMKHV